MKAGRAEYEERRAAAAAAPNEKSNAAWRLGAAEE